MDLNFTNFRMDLNCTKFRTDLIFTKFRIDVIFTKFRTNVIFFQIQNGRYFATFLDSKQQKGDTCSKFFTFFNVSVNGTVNGTGSIITIWRGYMILVNC